MPISDYEMVKAWQQVLTLSRLQAGQTVTVLTSAATHPQTLATALIATQAMGAVVNRLDLPPVNGERALSRDALAYLGTTPLTGNKAAIAALKESDLVLDLMTLLFSPEQHEILASGTKILLAVEPPEVLARLVPTEADRARVKAAAARIGAAREMSVVSEAGTDLRCPLGEFPAISEYGFVDEPGRWDHWPSGFVLTWPNEGGAGQDRDRCGRHPAAAETLCALGHRADRRERLRHAHRRRRGRGTAARVRGVVQGSGSLRDFAHRLGSAAARAGPRWACTTAKPPSAWTRGPTRAISCSRWDRTTKPAAAAAPPATSTSAAAAPCGWTEDVVRQGRVLDGAGPRD